MVRLFKKFKKHLELKEHFSRNNSKGKIYELESWSSKIRDGICNLR
jgi:hypothetical protein